MKKKGSKKNKKVKTEMLIEDDSITLHKSRGNGTLRRQVWCDDEGNVTRYSLAYINHHQFHGDNGRVLGYDNSHGYHHKHYMGTIEAINFINWSDIEKRFQEEFEVIHAQIKKK